MTRLLLYIITCAAVPRVRARRAATGGFTLPFIVVAVIAFATALLGLSFKPRYWSGWRGPAA